MGEVGLRSGLLANLLPPRLLAASLLLAGCAHLPMAGDAALARQLQRR